MKKSIFFVMSLCLAVVMSGCISSGSGEEKIRKEKYTMGNYIVELNANLIQMDKAVRTACYNLRLLEESRTNRENSCSYVYKDVNGCELNVTVEEFAPGKMRVTMRAGQLGDRVSCQQVIQAIENNLAMPK